MQQKILVINNRSKTSNSPLLEYAIFVFVILSFVFYCVNASFLYTNGIYQVDVLYQTIKSNFWITCLLYGLIEYLIFELVMRLYLYIVSFSLYTFVIPKKECMTIIRFFYAIKNIIMGAILIGVLYFPLMNNYCSVINLLVSILIIFLFFIYIKKRYLNNVLAPFVFKAFLMPIIIFEMLLSIFNVGVLLI